MENASPHHRHQLDRRRRSRSHSRSRSRSRSRTRPRNSYSGSRRDSDWRPLGGDFDQPRSGDLDQSKVPAESRTAADHDDEVDRDDVDKLPRDPKILHSEVVMVEDGASHEDEDTVEPEHNGARPEDEDAEYEYEEVVESDEHGEDDDGVTYEYEEMETEDNGQDDEAAAVAGLNDAYVVEINANHQLPMVDVHPSEPTKEPAHTQSQLSDVEEDTKAGVVRVDAYLIEPVAENSDCSEVRGNGNREHSDSRDKKRQATVA
ncbi:hypothetical protein ZWY2020_016274 [Hordeum vulgare]|nr:hypothetical protein ZWY2020_016274 [Hordeum vulgare]